MGAEILAGIIALIFAELSSAAKLDRDQPIGFAGLSLQRLSAKDAKMKLWLASSCFRCKRALRPASKDSDHCLGTVPLLIYNADVGWPANTSYEYL